MITKYICELCPIDSKLKTASQIDYRYKDNGIWLYVCIKCANELEGEK